MHHYTCISKDMKLKNKAISILLTPKKIKNGLTTEQLKNMKFLHGLKPIQRRKK